jgi:bacillolysin
MRKNLRSIPTQIFSWRTLLVGFGLAVWCAARCQADETNIIDVLRTALNAYHEATVLVAPSNVSQSALDPLVPLLAGKLQLLALGGLVVNSNTFAFTPKKSAQADAVGQLHARAGDDLIIHLRGNNTPMSIQGRRLELAHNGSSPGIMGGRDQITARNFLRSNRALLLLNDPDNELVLAGHENDRSGNSHLRFSQVYGGLPVWPAMLSLHLNSGGNVYLMDGCYAGSPSQVATQPLLGAADALTAARSVIPSRTVVILKTPELIVFAPIDGEPRLAWKAELDDDLANEWLIVVDALNGGVLMRVNQCMSENVAGSGTDLLGFTRPLNVWHQGSSYYLIDTSKPMFNPVFNPIQSPRGAILVGDARNLGVTNADFVISFNANSWLVPEAVSAAFNFSQTYDYYLDHHDRNSYDNNGGTLSAIVRVGTPFSDAHNAYWSGEHKLMVFGNADRYAASLDVIGHELTHGVTQSSAALLYLNQSGALNEAFSDVFGEMVEARTMGATDWLIGSQLVQPLRNMSNPPAFFIDSTGRRYPGTMSNFIQSTDPFLNNFSYGDYGGVHENSSIINHAYYYLSAGLTGAIGIRDAERIFYQCLTKHLAPQSQFIDARIGCIASAEELFGSGSIQAIKTAQAFDAVEIFGAPAVPDPSRIPAVFAPDSTLFLYRGFFDSSDSIWRRETAQGDSSGGHKLITGASHSRPTVSGDGSGAVYVTDLNDFGVLATDGTTNLLAGLSGRVHSVTISPDGRYWGFVLLNASGVATNKITVIDTASGGTNRTFTLVAPAIDAEVLTNVLYADVLNITYDGRLLIYDALSEIRLANGNTDRAWSIYAIDLISGSTKVIVPPIEGFDIGNPALSHTSTRYLTFDAVQQSSGNAVIVNLDLETGDFAAVSPVLSRSGHPAFNGDDSAVVYTGADSGAISGLSLFRQPLLPDHLHTNGAPTLWLRDGWLGVIYRRGTFISTNSAPTARIASPANGATFTYPATLQIQAVAGDSDGTIAKVEFYAGSLKLGEANSAPYIVTWANVVPGSYRLYARVIDNLGGTMDSNPVTVTVNQAVPLRIQSVTRLGDGRLQGSAIGSIGLTNVVEYSSDLKNWTILTNIVNTSGTFQFVDPAPAELDRRFYRARQK